MMAPFVATATREPDGSISAVITLDDWPIMWVTNLPGSGPGALAEAEAAAIYQLAGRLAAAIEGET